MRRLRVEAIAYPYDNKVRNELILQPVKRAVSEE